MSKQTKAGDLSRATFMAGKQSSQALADFADHLLGEKGLDHVLTGKSSSGFTEHWFGWYCQLSGANYFMTCRQFLEAEKKIHLYCLVKHGNLTLQGVQEVFCQNEDTQDEAATLVTMLPEDCLSVEFKLENDGQADIMLHVSGYIAHSLEERKVP